jgi:hypothetical protein
MRDTIDMAREAGIKFSPAQFSGVLEAEIDEFSLKDFEALIRADEREACAKTKVGKPRELKPVGRGTLLDEQQFCFDKGWREGVAALRAAIRARGNT